MVGFSMNGAPLIRLQEVSKAYTMGGRQFLALHEVSLEIAQGEFVALLGPSGSGKSTLLHIVGGLDRPTTGTVVVGNRDISGLSERELASFRNAEVGFVFQAFHLLPHLSVVQNVRLPLLYARQRGVDERTWVRQVIAAVGLSEKLRNRPSELSGGEQQRVAIARALVCDPQLVLADEPTGNLDSKTGEDIVRLFLALHRAGKTVVLVTHEEHLARHADRVLTLKDGHLV